MPALEPVSMVPAYRVFIHHTRGDPVGQARADRVAASLANGAFVVADTREVPFAIRRNALRFFFPGDADPARELGQQLSAELGGEPLPRHDFSHYRPLPASGTIEIWLASSG